MTITSSTQSPSPTGNTPTATPITTGTLTAIRASIQPRTGWWQFEWPKLPRPDRWQVALFVGVYAAVLAFGIGWTALYGFNR